MRVLVLGAGFIGSAVAHALHGAGHEVTILTRSAPSAHSLDLVSGCAVVVGDAREMGILSGLISEVDQVVYAIGSSSPAESDLDPANDISLVVPPLVQLLELLRLRREVRVTFLSSGGTVYGNCVETPIHESVVPEPISSYGILKLTSEKYLGMYANNFRIPVSILRVGNAYGPGQPAARSQGVVPHLFRSAITGEALPLYGPPSNARDFIYVDDVAKAVVALAERPTVPRVLNVGTGVGHTVPQVAALVTEVTGLSIDIKRHRSRSFDVGVNILDCSALSGIVDFQPIDLRNGLERTWAALGSMAEQQAITLLDDMPALSLRILGP